MRILVVHNRYQLAGGEDSVFDAETELLRNAGYDIATLTVSNDDIEGRWATAQAALTVAYNPGGRRKVAAAIAAHRAELVHVHNFFPLISPSMFDACRAAGVPAIWTLHNFRVTCANGLLFRNGKPCELCVGHAPWPAVFHRCYRQSVPGSAAVAAMIGYHKLAGTWQHKVDRFIALTDFARDMFIRSGLPAERIAVKANVLRDPGHPASALGRRTGAVYVGRLSIEKGVDCLLSAWRGLAVPLTVIGDGPERAVLEACAPQHVRFAGWLGRAEVDAAIAQAQALIVPSLWYENFPMTVVEATAFGTPVIASRLGSLESIVEDGVSGALFAPGDPDDLARVVRSWFAQPDRLAQLGAGARLSYERRSAPGVNLEQLVAIYRSARKRPS